MLLEPRVDRAREAVVGMKTDRFGTPPSSEDTLTLILRRTVGLGYVADEAQPSERLADFTRRTGGIGAGIERDPRFDRRLHAFLPRLVPGRGGDIGVHHGLLERIHPEPFIMAGRSQRQIGRIAPRG